VRAAKRVADITLKRLTENMLMSAHGDTGSVGTNPWHYAWYLKVATPAASYPGQPILCGIIHPRPKGCQVPAENAAALEISLSRVTGQ